ncbi:MULTISPECIES: glycosyltransferase [unclassified Chelatococcus]|uniref:CgeB family protein n=1 Tax=unclassified Chelatococcus TaxID=2638111 RepID=UPI0002EA169C|nr:MULTISPECIES: glycosyltransferase [unclassified Chelatococcus]ALA19199.1 glycosyltransferase [Chelatococcus sp. CO-6]
MRFLFYTHSLVSDWNHGNAHFLRGVMRELLARGHEALALEPADGWSRTNLLADQGEVAVERFARDFPMLRSQVYGPDFAHEKALDEADVVIVHEWTDPALVARIGRARREGGRFTLIFHDTHHRAVSARPEIAALQLKDYDCVLAFGEALRQRYLAAGWGGEVATWHEAADTRLFRPLEEERRGDLVWIGNWGDGERSAELAAMLIEPARRLGLAGEVRGVRYPPEALEQLATTGLKYRGWIANADVPIAFARHRVTVHVPRRPYVEALPGIPTIRVFEALACGIPLVSAPWSDSEGLFRPGEDFLVASDGEAMARMLRDVLHDPALAASLAASGLRTILARHTCAHRVDELLGLIARRGTDAVRRQIPLMEAAAR